MRFKACSIDGCGSNAHSDGRGARGWCNAHYQRWSAYGDPLGSAEPKPTFKPCLVDGCQGNASYHAEGSQGYCNRHLARLRRNGDPLAGKTPDGEALRFLEQEVLTHDDASSCLTWPYIRLDNGYGQVVHEGRKKIASRLVCELLNGPPPTPKHHAAHSCGKGHEGCVNPKHLSWKTPQENMADRTAHGTVARGDKSGVSKLTSDQVRQIRRMEGTQRAEDLADKFNISVSTIFNIQARRAWRHLDA